MQAEWGKSLRIRIQVDERLGAKDSNLSQGFLGLVFVYNFLLQKQRLPAVVQ